MSLIDQSTFAGLREMSGDELLNELIDVFLVDAPRMITAMQTALEATDVDAFRRNAQSLKSNAETFGATALAALAKELEVMARAGNLAVGSRLDALREASASACGELAGLRP